MSGRKHMPLTGHHPVVLTSSSQLKVEMKRAEVFVSWDAGAFP